MNTESWVITDKGADGYFFRPGGVERVSHLWLPLGVMRIELGNAQHWLECIEKDGLDTGLELEIATGCLDRCRAILEGCIAIAEGPEVQMEIPELCNKTEE